MKRKLKSHKKNARNFLVSNIKNNINIYFSIIIIFILGIAIGVLFTNRRQESDIKIVNDSVRQVIENIKNNTSILKTEILKKSIIKNILVVFALWILGLTYFGKFLLYVFVFLLGVTFGYTSASIFVALEFLKGILFVSAGILPHNIILIPSIIFTCANGIKCHNDKKEKNSIMIKYTAICVICIIMLILSSFIETYLSVFSLQNISKYL